MNEIRWVDLEYPYKERSVDWFWGLGVFSVIIAIVAVYLGNTLFGIFVIIGALSIAIFSLRKPREVDYIIGERRISVGDSHYHYNDIESFYIDEQREEDKIVLRLNKVFLPFLIIKIKDHHPNIIREVLANKLPEVEHREPLLHAIADRLGF